MGIRHSRECEQQMLCPDELTSINVRQRRGLVEDCLCIGMDREIDRCGNLGCGSMPPGYVFSDPGNRERLGKHLRWRRGDPQKSQENMLCLDRRTAHAPGF